MPLRFSAQRMRFLALLAAFGAVTLIAALALRHSQKGVYGVTLQLAAWLRGGPRPEVTTWPAWGYPLLLAQMPSPRWVLVMQATLGCIALAALAWRLCALLPRQRPLLIVLCVLAVPWHNMQATPYPDAIPGSLAMLALLSLERALARGGIRWALLAGLLIGVAQNFRTEFVLLPCFLGISLFLLKLAGIVRTPLLRPISALIVVALAFQIPWAIYYHSQTGRYALTESNFGHVIYTSLGTSPGNPWSIEPSDEGTARALLAAGYSFSSLSDAGSRVLLELARHKVQEHPSALVGRTGQLVRDTVLAPFNWGEPDLDAQTAGHLDVLRQELKARVAVGVNPAKLTAYRANGAWSVAHADSTARQALLYQVVTIGLGSAIFVLAIAGMAIVILRSGPRPGTALLYLLGATALYKTLQDMLLFYQVNYLDNVYPMFLPFACISLTTVADLLRRRHVAMRSA